MNDPDFKKQMISLGIEEPVDTRLHVKVGEGRGVPLEGIVTFPAPRDLTEGMADLVRGIKVGFQPDKFCNREPIYAGVSVIY